MSLNINLNNFRSNYEVPIDHLPYDLQTKGSKGLGVFLIVFASFWGGMPGYFFIKMLRDGEFESSQAFILIFPIIGMVLFLFGLAQFFLEQNWKITSSHIIYKKKGFFGPKEWVEPLSKYRGILSATEQRSSGEKNSSTYTVYVIYLKHDDYKKTIKLYESRSNSFVRQKWEEYARVFNKSAIEKSGKGYIERKVEDLDKSVKERVESGDLYVKYHPALPVPKGLEASQKRDGLLIIQNAKQKGFLFSFPFILAFVGIFIYIGFYGDAPIIFGFVGLFFLALFVIGFIWEIISRPCYAVAKDGIRIFRLTPWGKTKSKDFKADNIESIDIKRTGNNIDALVISTDQRQESIGLGLSKEARQWMRGCMIYTIAQK